MRRAVSRTNKCLSFESNYRLNYARYLRFGIRCGVVPHVMNRGSRYIFLHADKRDVASTGSRVSV